MVDDLWLLFFFFILSTGFESLNICLHIVTSEKTEFSHRT